MIRIEADTPEELLTLVREQRSDPHRKVPGTLHNDVTAVVPVGLDDDELIALCAALAIEGVAAIDTDRPRIAKRCLDANRVLTGKAGIELS